MSNDLKYKWDHPSDWLHEHINGHENLEDLKRVARQLASQLDGDQIQDEFQDRMDEDGYFTPIVDEDDPRQFTLDGEPITLAALLEANEGDEEVAKAADLPVGGVITIGGGAAAAFEIRRVS